MSRSSRRSAVTAVQEALSGSELEWERAGEDTFHVVLPGERKLQTPVRITVGEHSVGLHAFVCRCPDENFEGVYRWVLERNMRTFGVAFALDQAGDIYLASLLPHEAVTAESLDRLLGSVLDQADGSFNTLIELGFATSIRKEWEWRTSRGESTRNLDAFRGWLGVEE